MKIEFRILKSLHYDENIIMIIKIFGEKKIYIKEKLAKELKISSFFLFKYLNKMYFSLINKTFPKHLMLKHQQHFFFIIHFNI